MYHLKMNKIKYEQMKQEEMENNYYVNIRDVDPIFHANMGRNAEQNNMSNLAKVGQNLIRLSSQSKFIPIGVNNYDSNNFVESNEGINMGINEGLNVGINEGLNEGLNEGIDDPRNNLDGNDESSKNNMEIESETVFQPNDEENF